MLDLFFLLLGLSLGLPHGSPAPLPSFAPDAPTATGLSAAPSATGTVRGTFRVEERPARRRARSYGGGVTTPRPPQELSRLVWIRGAMAGQPPESNGMPSIAQQDSAFVPAFVSIPVGGKVSFPNRDDFFHNVFSYSSGARFDLGRYGRGETKEVTFDVPGLVSVFCEVHDRMRAAILVAENPFHTQVGPDGSFEFEGVPAGTWTVVGWDPDRGETTTTITVQDGATTDVELELG